MHIIVGIDTGKTSAIACLSLDGKLIYSAHIRQADESWFISTIHSIGMPVIIASDKTEHANNAIRKINATFSATVFYPEKVITQKEKRQLAKVAGLKDQHERDAYTAALKAYNVHSNKLRQAERIASSMNVSNTDIIKAKVIKHYSVNEAIENRIAHRMANKKRRY